jgi:hypothetical protein
MRRLLFTVEELERWENGCALETKQLPRGGRLVRPVDADNGGRSRRR